MRGAVTAVFIVALAACESSSPIVETRAIRLCPPASLAERPVMPQRRDATVRALGEAYVDALSELKRAQDRAEELDAWLLSCRDGED